MVRAEGGRDLVAGIDSSTQSCKVVICDAETGAVLRRGAAPHPDGTSVDPARWWSALQAAATQAGGLDDVAALSVGAQQHGMVCLADDGSVVRDALLWNDTRSAGAAEDLIAEVPDGRRVWAHATGSVPVASFTVTKLRWLRDHEPEPAARTAAVCLPHDWLTWCLRGAPEPTHTDALVTDRSDASGTGYWSPATGTYRHDLLELALGSRPLLPRVLGPREPAGEVRGGLPFAPDGLLLGPGAGDNAASALGLGAVPGDVIVSIGTSGVACAVSATPTSDPSGAVAGFADATGRFLPLVCTLNAARVLDATAAMLGVDHAELSRLALSAPPGADGLVVVPYLEGERTPDRPRATGAIHGWRLSTSTPAHLARAAIEGMLCGLADGLDALRDQGVAIGKVLLIGGGAQSEAVRRIAPTIFGTAVDVPETGEYVATGAARQAAWALTGDAEPPRWQPAIAARHEADAIPRIRDRYREVRELTAESAR